MSVGCNDNDITRDKPLYIREFQTYLRSIAAHDRRITSIAVDGIYGPETTAAVKAFQVAYQLPVTGTVDRATWTAIYQVYLEFFRLASPPRTVDPFPSADYVVRRGETGDLVYMIQIMLDSISHEFTNLLPVSLTGVYDEDTAQAVRRLQTIRDLKPDGRTDKTTWDALTDTYNASRPHKNIPSVPQPLDSSAQEEELPSEGGA